MALRAQFEHCDDVGVFAKLTNTYCLVGTGRSEAFFSIFENEIGDAIPIVHTSIANCQIVGRLVVGNRHGLLVPNNTTEEEMIHLRNSLPDAIRIRRIDERLSALGNVISCNDHMAIAHPDIDKDTEEIVQDVLNVEFFRETVADQQLVGSYCAFNNKGGIVHPKTSKLDLHELSSLLQIPLTLGTVNRGSPLIGPGLIVNDWTAFCGNRTTAIELSVIDHIFKLDPNAIGRDPIDLTTEKGKQSIVEGMS
ncbi:hypothetical protein SNEBB_010239 [Seison nebaliae]|nr:hypothetical protein SNEBB_010239 [Seison nebaliae]